MTPAAGPIPGELTVREVHRVEELGDIDRLFGRIWQYPPGEGPIGVELMRALSHAGNYVAGAYRGTRLVGASVGFLSAPPGLALHSHVTGADQGRGIGFALKQHQRDWALARGLDRITWTFDPLVRRNAYFNLTKLGATLEEYHSGFYGRMRDAINGGDDSDRVLARWDLHAPHVSAAASGVRTTGPGVSRHGVSGHGVAVAEAPVSVLAEGRDGRPLLLSTDSSTVLVELPPDIEALRRTDPAAATSWRLAVREVLGGLLADGARVTGLHGRTGYVVDRAPLRPASASFSRPEHLPPMESQNR
ncbi:GNAT family N-acetyltransferase [Streptomyces sp. NPDC094032]|uniref:GNAT family N-acetyltransferase n=1 Tax=Streptomyces sp. NPDC094032 TaxID=3155308 RepID=UPI00332B8695